MIPMSSTARRITGVAVLIGLLGAALATLALVDISASPPMARRPTGTGAGLGELSPAGAAGTGTTGGASTSTSTGTGTGGTGTGTGGAADSAARSRAGLRLLSEAAAADTRTSYQGEQIVAWWGPHGGTTSVVQVWHERDRSVLAQVSDMGSVSSAGSAQPSAAGGQDPDGILGLSSQLLTLMRANYQVADSGQGRAAGRPTQIVELRRRDGSLAARFWLDAVTKLPLRREIFDSRSRMISEDAFISLRIGSSVLQDMPATGARPWSARLDAAQIAALRAQGWPLPAQLPDNLRLVTAHRTATTAGPVIDLDYSDGLFVVSVFLQRGQLPGTLPGWREITLRGRAFYSADPDLRSLAWSARGFVYTVIAEAPAATVDHVIDALPHEAGPGFWHRIAHGLRRLASWVNPFR